MCIYVCMNVCVCVCRSVDLFPFISYAYFQVNSGRLGCLIGPYLDKNLCIQMCLCCVRLCMYERVRKGKKERGLKHS